MSASSYVVNMVRPFCPEIGWNPMIDYPLSQTRAPKSVLSLSTTSTVNPCNSGLLHLPEFFHYYRGFHYFDRTFSRKCHFDHSDVVHYFAGFHYFAVHYCGVLLYHRKCETVTIMVFNHVSLPSVLKL